VDVFHFGCGRSVSWHCDLLLASRVGFDARHRPREGEQLSSRSIGSARTSTTSGKSTTWPRSAGQDRQRDHEHQADVAVIKTNVARGDPNARRGHLRLRDNGAPPATTPSSRQRLEDRATNVSTSWPRARRRDPLEPQELQDRVGPGTQHPGQRGRSARPVSTGPAAKVIPLRGRLSGVAQPRTGSGEGHIATFIAQPRRPRRRRRDVLQRTKSRRRHHESHRLAREHRDQRA